MRSFIVLLLIGSICLNGCANVTTDSVVWRAQDIAFSDYQSLQVVDIFNASGKPINREILVFFADRLKEQLENSGLEIVEQRPESGNTLLVRTSIVYIEYERPVIGSARGNTATVKESVVSLQIVMLDQALNRTVAEIKNVTTYSSSGYKQHDRKKTLFRQVAKVSAGEIEKLIRSADPQ